MKRSNRTFIAMIAGILVISAITGFLVWKKRPSQMQVVVTMNGVECGSFPLNEEKTVIISPEDNRWHNTLVIKDGQAKIVESDCENQICVMTPALSSNSFGIIVCLPHGLAVELK